MNDELKHHGRKGQHWGIRNGPPYPLSRRFSPEQIKAKLAAARAFPELDPRARKVASLVGRTAKNIGGSIKTKAKQKIDEYNSEENVAKRAQRKQEKAEARELRRRAKEEVRAAKAKEKEEALARQREEDEAKKQAEALKTEQKQAEITKKKEEEKTQKQTLDNLKRLSKNPKLAREMSNEEREEVYKRLQKEKNITDLLVQKQNNIQKVTGKGESFVKSVMDDIGNNVIKPGITGVAAYALYKMVSEELTNAIPDDPSSKAYGDKLKDVDKVLGMIFARVNKSKK